MANSRIVEDPRIDPRIKALFGAFDMPPSLGDVASREELLEEANSEDALARRTILTEFMAMCDTEEVAPSKGLNVTEYSVTSEPDGNTINIRFIRPDAPRTAAVRLLHPWRRHADRCPATTATYRAWGRIIAAQGVAVAMVDFRNCVVPSSAPEVAPFPAGLNDCVSGVKWVAAHARRARHRPRPHRRRGRERRREPHARHRSPAEARRRPRPHPRSLRAVPVHRRAVAAMENPSSTENNGILLDLHNNRGAMAYGIDEFASRNPLAWPGFADRGRRARASCPR